MNLMICMRGEPEQTSFLPEIAALGAGIELGSYGMLGIRSEQEWNARCALHQAVRSQFKGVLAIHGPFLGMDYAHPDHLIREAVKRRLDLTLDVAANLQASRVILHSSYKPEIEIFHLQESWLKGCVEFWRQEIPRWAEAGILVVLENDLEKSPDLLVRLVDEVDHPFLKVCMDIGHQNVFSDVKAAEWVQRLGTRLVHVHLHDNDGQEDRHWSLGRGEIDFESFYAAIWQHAPEATLSLEVEEDMEVRMTNLRQLTARFLPK